MGVLEIAETLTDLFTWAIDHEVPGAEDVQMAMSCLTNGERQKSFYLVGFALEKIQQHLRCIGDDNLASLTEEMIERWHEDKRYGGDFHG